MVIGSDLRPQELGDYVLDSLWKYCAQHQISGLGYTPGLRTLVTMDRQFVDTRDLPGWNLAKSKAVTRGSAASLT